MWIDVYEKLTNSEKEEFKRLANMLLSKTFIIRDYYDSKEEMMKISPEYRFIERNFELFSGYFYYYGWDLRKDNQYGVISIENTYEYNRLKLDRFTTFILYTIRLIYEEEREHISLRNETVTTIGQIIHKMINLNLIKKKPSDYDISHSLRLLSNHNLVQKITGAWENADTKILILPSVLFVVSNERISKIYELVENGEYTQDENDGDHETASEIIRGEGEEI
jgi:ribosomal protein S24E